MKRVVFIATMLGVMAMAAGAVDLPGTSVVCPDIDEASMRCHFDSLDVQPLEGLWYYPDEDMTIAIERWNGASGVDYRLLLVASDDLELLPGTVIGYMASSAVDSKLHLWLYTERDHVTLHKPLECVATASADFTTLTFDPPRWKVKVRVNFARFLPTLFRGISVVPEKQEERLPQGFKKIYPEGGNGHKVNRKRYL